MPHAGTCVGVLHDPGKGACAHRASLFTLGSFTIFLQIQKDLDDLDSTGALNTWIVVVDPRRGLAIYTYDIHNNQLAHEKCTHNSHQHRERVKSEHNARARRSDRNTDSRPALSTTPEPRKTRQTSMRSAPRAYR